VLVAFGHVLSFLVLFVAIADAAERSGFANQAAALVCGILAIWFTRLYVRIILAMRLDPSNTPERIPAWAIAVYAAIGAAFVLLAMRAGATGPALELLVGWAAGCNLLNYLWTRRLLPDTPAALDVAEGWLRAQAAAHRTFSDTLAFLLLFAGVGAHALETGFAHVVAGQCGPSCASNSFVHAAAVLVGFAAIFFVMLYATVTEGLRWLLVEKWMHVRPGPPPSDLPRWVIVLHVLIGFAVFFAIATFGDAPAAKPVGGTFLSVDGTELGGSRVILSNLALLELVLGWWIGGLVVLRFFWLRRRAAR